MNWGDRVGTRAAKAEVVPVLNERPCLVNGFCEVFPGQGRSRALKCDLATLERGERADTVSEFAVVVSGTFQ